MDFGVRCPVLLSARFPKGFRIRITIIIVPTPHIQLIPWYILTTLGTPPLPSDPLICNHFSHFQD
jgi:hypothetical protein